MAAARAARKQPSSPRALIQSNQKMTSEKHDVAILFGYVCALMAAMALVHWGMPLLRSRLAPVIKKRTPCEKCRQHHVFPLEACLVRNSETD
jgi:hypothetical protein